MNPSRHIALLVNGKKSLTIAVKLSIQVAFRGPSGASV